MLTGGGSCLAGAAERIEAELKNAARYHSLPTIAGQVRVRVRVRVNLTLALTPTLTLTRRTASSC